MTTETPAIRVILVPLDRSERAERALPVAERLAAAFNSTLLLAQVSEPVATLRDFPGPAIVPGVYRELSEIEDQLTREYLDRIGASVRDKGLAVVTRGLHGQPAPILLDLEESEHVDLVVMASHGHGGIERFAFGSVADRILRHGTAPVLVVRPWGDERRYQSLAHALLPLDGSTTAEAAFSMVQALAGDPVHHVTLLRVVDPDVPAGETEAARAYLQATRERLSAELGDRGCAVDELVRYGGAAEQIVDASQEGYDLLIVSTHGRTGPRRWVLGSVADRVLQGARIPVLLVRAPKESPAS